MFAVRTEDKVRVLQKGTVIHISGTTMFYLVFFVFLKAPDELFDVNRVLQMIPA